MHPALAARAEPRVGEHPGEQQLPRALMEVRPRVAEEMGVRVAADRLELHPKLLDQRARLGVHVVAKRS